MLKYLDVMKTEIYFKVIQGHGGQEGLITTGRELVIVGVMGT